MDKCHISNVIRDSDDDEHSDASSASSKKYSIYVGPHASSIIRNSEFEKEPHDYLGHILSYKRIICDNCKFDQKDYWNDDDIIFNDRNFGFI